MSAEIIDTAITYLRLMAYAMCALLFGLVFPIWHRSFRLTWRALGLFFLTAGVLLVLRLYVSAEAYAQFANWCLTPATFALALAALSNLRLVSVWRQAKAK